MEISSFLSLRA